MQKIWKIKKEQPEKDETFFGGKYSRIVLQILANRGIKKPEEIEKFFSFSYDQDVADPFLFFAMEKAVERIISAKEKKEKITVYGDYDADGVTATVILVEALRNLGFENLDYYIPNRYDEGYGLNIGAIEEIRKRKTDLIITVDCGVSNFSEAEKVKELGMDMVITDHHHIISGRVPEAVAVLNPHIEDGGYNFPDLSGAGVAFKLVQALYKKMAPEKIDQLKWALDLAAVGTIADCVPLLGENRALVKYGLVVLSKTKRTGLQELFKVGRIIINENAIPDAHKVAFQIAPRINAAGRMDHANVSCELIMQKNAVMARDLALQLEEKNQQRQKMTMEIVREAQAIAENSFKNKKFIFAYSENWPVGILGLAAGRIADEFNKPVMILQKRDGFFVGSLRSIPQLNIAEVLEECAELLDRFGGHSQAAGAQIKAENIDKFYEKFSSLIEEKLAGQDLSPIVEADAEMNPEDVSWELLEQIKKMAPFGEGNEEPVFLMKGMLVEDFRLVGNGNKHIKMGLRGKNGSPKIFETIGFSMGEKAVKIRAGSELDIMFSIQEDEWNGNKKIQLNLVDFKIISE